MREQEALGIWIIYPPCIHSYLAKTKVTLGISHLERRMIVGIRTATRSEEFPSRYEISRALGNGNESGAAAADIIARGKAGTLAGWREGELGFVKGKTLQVP